MISVTPIPAQASAWQTAISQLPRRPSPQRAALSRPLLHQISQTQVLPSRFPSLLRGSLNPKCCMLIWHYVILIFGIQWLIMRRDIDLVIRQLVFAEVLEEISVPRPVEVHVIMVRVLGLVSLVSMPYICREDDLYHLLNPGYGSVEYFMDLQACWYYCYHLRESLWDVALLWQPRVLEHLVLRAEMV